MGEVCTEKTKKLWKERKKDLTRTCIVRDGRVWLVALGTDVGRALEVTPWSPKGDTRVMYIRGPVEQFSDLPENAFQQGEFE